MGRKEEKRKGERVERSKGLPGTLSIRFFSVANNIYIDSAMDHDGTRSRGKKEEEKRDIFKWMVICKVCAAFPP